MKECYACSGCGEICDDCGEIPDNCDCEPSDKWENIIPCETCGGEGVLV